MAGNLMPSDIDDLVITTLKKLGRGKIVQIAQSQTHYEVYSRWFKKDRVAMDGGVGIQRTLHDKLANSSKHHGLYEKFSVNVINLLTNISIPWCFATSQWGYVEEEIIMNKGESRINKIIEPRRNTATIDHIEDIEAKAFSCPELANTEEPYGLLYWIVANSTTGFNGGLPPGHSTIAGITLTDHPHYKNYTGEYSEVGETLLGYLRTANRKTRWISPINKGDDSKALRDQFRVYANEATISSMEDTLKARNDNLGPDLASVTNSMVGLRLSEDGPTFYGHPIIWVEQLDSVSTNPIIGVNHNVFYPVILQGQYFRENGPKDVDGQPTARAFFMHTAYNYFCENRRACWRFDQAA